MNKETTRNEFLMRMYDQLYNDINRHIMVIWQSIVVLTGAIAALILQGKSLLPISITTTIIIIITAWVIAHTLDSSYWYNRNLVIIANIEKQFLHEDDLVLIHFYFSKHRQKNKMISHLRIQLLLAIIIGAIAILYQFYYLLTLGCNDLSSILPISAVLIAIFMLFKFKQGCNKRYAEFIKNSPGRKINFSICDGIIGHSGD